MADDGQNIITLSEDLLNRTFREKILSSPAGEYITDYKVAFSQGCIYLDLKLSIKTLGALTAKYKIEVVDFVFKPDKRMLIADYMEDVSSAGSLTQSMMLKMIGLKGGTFLQMAAGMANLAGVKADAKSCSVDLEQLIKPKGDLASMIMLEYLDSRNGALKFSYQLVL